MKDWKFKVGEAVFVDPDITSPYKSFSRNGDGKFPISDSMRFYAGKIVIIKECVRSNLFSYTNLYKIKDNHNIWSEPIFKRIEGLFE